MCLSRLGSSSSEGWRSGLHQFDAIDSVRNWSDGSGECALPDWWPPKGAQRESFEVLHDGGEMKFITRAGKSPEPHSFEAMVDFQVREAHLDTFSVVSRLGECLGLHLLPCNIASVFMEIALARARLCRGAALRSDRTSVAVSLQCTVAQRASVVHRASGPQQLAVRTYIDTALLVPAKVRA